MWHEVCLGWWSPSFAVCIYKIGDGEVIDTSGSELIPMRVKKVAVLIFIEFLVMMDRSERELL
jgi:hypothetical protein